MILLTGTTYPDAVPKARTAAERAVVLDPNLPEAHSTFGTILVRTRDWRGAERELKRALELNPNDSGPHLAYARYLTFCCWDWRGAERELKRALELNPNDSDPHQAYAMYLVSMGQTDEAVAEAKRARELDPLSVFSNREVGIMLYQARRYDEALVELQRTTEMFPSSENLFFWQGFVYLAKGMPEKAFEVELKRRAVRGDSPEGLAAFRRAVEKSGMRGYFETFLKNGNRNGFASIALGRYDEAFEVLENEYEHRRIAIIFITVDPKLDPIRSDPRFQDLLRRMRLAP